MSFSGIKKNLGIFVFFLLLPVFVLSCASSSSSQHHAQVPPLPNDDPSYAPILKKWERTAELYKDLELQFRVNTVLMSPEMQTAYKERSAKIRGPNALLDSNLVGNPNKVALVVTLFTHSKQFSNLSDARLWNLVLFYQGKWLAPTFVEAYQKPILSAYFSQAGYWSQQYVVTFQVDGKVLDASQFSELSQLAKGHSVLFSMRSGEAQAQFVW